MFSAWVFQHMYTTIAIVNFVFWTVFLYRDAIDYSRWEPENTKQIYSQRLWMWYWLAFMNLWFQVMLDRILLP